jgi:Hypothetical glycosyl hydrolase family 15
VRGATFGMRTLAALAAAAIVVVAASHAERAQASVAETVGTFGTTTIGASSSSYTANRKQVGRYPLPTAGSVTKLSIYLAPTGTKGQQVIRGIIYADASGKPQALLGASEQLTFKSTSSAGWYELKFPSPVTLTVGSYWIGVLTGVKGKVAGFRFTKVTAARNYNDNTYSSGPSNPFGSGSIDAKQISLYATYIQRGAPVEISPPAISGTARQGQTLSEVHGSWTNEPTGYAYQWLQCDSLGSGCLPIAGATSQTYVPVAADVGHALKVEETATNAGGSGSATSAATAAVAAVVVITAGAVKWRLDAKSYFDPFSGEVGWLQAHIDRILGYATFADRYVKDGIPTLDYDNSYTRWGSFGLTAAHIAEVEGICKAEHERGYAGEFLDDVEFTSGFHQAGTPQQLAEMVEACRRGLGPSGVLEINTQYADLHTRLAEPYAARALAVTDYVDNEFGVNPDSPIKSPTAFAERLAYIDALHAKGIHIDEEDVEAGKPGDEYEVASYLLINDGHDYFGTHVTPTEWKAIYDTNLGAALSDRELIGGVYRRSFTQGTVYVDPPGGPTVTLDGHALGARTGLIVP